jgi:hypothetical protein
MSEVEWRDEGLSVGCGCGVVRHGCWLWFYLAFKYINDLDFIMTPIFQDTALTLCSAFIAFVFIM